LLHTVETSDNAFLANTGTKLMLIDIGSPMKYKFTAAALAAAHAAARARLT
jgi:hypothetical protein